MRCTVGHTGHIGEHQEAFLLQHIGFELVILAQLEWAEISRLRCALQAGNGPRSAVTAEVHVGTVSISLASKTGSASISHWFVAAPVYCRWVLFRECDLRRVFSDCQALSAWHIVPSASHVASSVSHSFCLAADCSVSGAFCRWQRLILHCKEGGVCAFTINTNSLFAFSLERKNSIEGQIPRTSRSKSSSASHRCGIKGHRRDVGREVMRVCVSPRHDDGRLTSLVEGGGDAGLMTQRTECRTAKPLKESRHRRFAAHAHPRWHGH